MSSIPRGDSRRNSTTEPKQRDITIIRGKHDSDNPYFVASRASAQDEQLTYDARGLLFYLLSKPDDWVIRIDDLRRAGCGRDKVYRIIDELVKAGYMTPRSKRQDDKGRWIWTPHRLYERPYPENPYTDNPYTENTEIKALSSESLSTENKKESSATNISVPSDTPITDALSDGKSTVAAQDASHNEVIAVADSTDSTPVEEEAVSPKGSTRSSKRKEKAIVHPAADETQAHKPTQDERHAMFEAVCAHLFGITSREEIRLMPNKDTTEAGAITSWLLKQNCEYKPNGAKSAKPIEVGWISAPAQPQHVALFARYYRSKYPNVSMATKIATFVKHWRAWASQQEQRKQQAQQRQQAENAQRAADAAKPRATPEELAAIKAEMEQMRSQLKAKKGAPLEQY